MKCKYNGGILNLFKDGDIIWKKNRFYRDFELSVGFYYDHQYKLKRMTLISIEIYTDSLVIAQTSDTSCLFEEKKTKLSGHTMK